MAGRGLSLATVSIDPAAPAQQIHFPDADGGWKPGDRSFMVFDLVNTGSSALDSVTLDITALQSSALDTDSVNGLQLALDG